MSCQAIDFQADRIEAVLAKHKVPGRVSGGLVSPRWIKFNVIPALDVRLSQAKGLDEALAATLGSDSCRVSRQGNRLSVEVPRTDPQPVQLLPLQKHIGDVPFGTAILGLAEDGAPLLARLPSPDVGHLLIAGITGSGTSTLARTIIVSLALNHRQDELGFVLIDTKGEGFEPLIGLPHLLRPVLRRPEEAGQALADLVETMLERDREACSVPAAALCASIPQRGGVDGDADAKPRVVVVIDELADLLVHTGPETLQTLTRLAQRGREAGIHLIVGGIQTLADDKVASLAEANFPVRLVGRMGSVSDARRATGTVDSGAERLAGRGDFLAVVRGLPSSAIGGRMTRFQAAYVAGDDLAVVRTWREV